MSTPDNSNLVIRKKTRADALRGDRWENTRKRFGSNRDPVTQTTFQRDISISRDLVDSLYRYDWPTRKAVDIPAEDATREWIRLEHDNQKLVEAAKTEIERLSLREIVEELIKLSRLYGGALTVVGAWDGREVHEPLGVPRATLFLANVDRFLAYPLHFYTDVLDGRRGEPELYQVTRPFVHGSDVRMIHETRLVRLDGNYLPPLERIRNFTYGASVIENILDATRQFGICSQSFAGVLQDFVTKKLKIENLQQLLQSDEGMDSLMLRLAELSAGLSIFNIATFGKDEEFDKMGTPITGLADLGDRFVEYLSAATGIPRARLFNNLSGKLGGDAGANDLRVHYDTVGAFQKNRLRPKIRRLLDIILAPLGLEPGEMGFEFEPMWQLSETEDAEVRLKVAESDKIYIDAGVIQPEEVAMSRFAGKGINLSDMHIETAPREKFLKEFAKTDPTKEPVPRAGGPKPGEDENQLNDPEGGDIDPKGNGKKKPGTDEDAATAND